MPPAKERRAPPSVGRLPVTAARTINRIRKGTRTAIPNVEPPRLGPFRFGLGSGHSRRRRQPEPRLSDNAVGILGVLPAAHGGGQPREGHFQLCGHPGHIRPRRHKWCAPGEKWGGTGRTGLLWASYGQSQACFATWLGAARGALRPSPSNRSSNRSRHWWTGSSGCSNSAPPMHLAQMNIPSTL